MSDQTNHVPSKEPDTSLLTPDDTWCMWIDSSDMRYHWATVAEETVVARDGTDTSAEEVQRWSVDLIEDETGTRFAVDHDAMLAAMHRIVHERDTIRLADTIIDQIAAVLDADDHDSATDELCQLDAVGHDAIVQVATVGQVIH
jgi:hypothetical protein